MNPGTPSRADSQRLGAFLRPRSVAVVGAGERATSSGGAVLRNLRICGWPGQVIPVNPKGGVIQSLPAVTHLGALSAPADLVVVAVRPDSILDVVREAAATGHRNLLILPGGFAEAGAAGAERDAALRALADEAGLLIAGPNCAGLINLMEPAAPFAATFLRDMPRGGAVAVISQSGAIAEELIAASHALGVPLGAVVSVGNAMHLGLVEYLEYLGTDEACKAILLYAESFGDAARFGEVARRVARDKPIAALVAGRTEAGRAAALRHTGSLAMGPAEAAKFCEAAGILRVSSLRELSLAGKAFAFHAAGLASSQVLVLSNSGGPGVLAADRAVFEGLSLPDLPAPLADALRQRLPPEAAVANPMDLLADAREDRFGPALETVLAQVPPDIGALLMIHVVPFMVDAGPVVEALARAAECAPLPILHSMMGTLEYRAEWFARLEQAGVPVFGDTEEMCFAAGLLARYGRLRYRQRGEAEHPPPA